MPPFRADRLATLYLFHPLRNLHRQAAGIPILMYHSISAPNDSNRHPYYQTVTSPHVFEQHLKFLRDSGYKSIGLTDALSRLHESPPDHARTVVITFDDGFADFYSQAFPLLSQYGFTATMFLPTSYIDRAPRKFKGVECLTWSQARELQKAGMHFGSHTVTHPQLKNLGPKELETEIRCSKRTIEDELGTAVASFSYPYAFPETDGPFRQRLGGLLEENGYQNGVSTIIGTANAAGARFFLKRLPINTCDDLPLFRAKLEGGYNWLHTVQYASKFLTAHPAESDKGPGEKIQFEGTK
jgi:peptidoglycan/xylan/chitin deacetylase (PgdA/CDA1 family)